MALKSCGAAKAAPIFLFLGLVGCGAGEPLEPLPRIQLDSQRVAVAGLSSGAYMATQTHLAWSDRVGGAALIAGGPYGCAEGSLETALGPCIKASPAAPNAGLLSIKAKERASKGDIAAIRHLQNDRILVLHGRQDMTVAEAVSGASVEFYRGLLAASGGDPLDQVIWDAGREFGHLMPTMSSGGDCLASEPPYLGSCRFDAAELVFSQLFGEARRAPQAQAQSQPASFDQNRYRRDGSDAYLADSGYVYLPPRCTAGESCGLLIAFHGCEQNAEKVGEAFIRDAGFNRWADAFDVVVLYPQTRASYVPLNPKACWDWWGFSGADYDTRRGVQQRWLMAALEALSGDA